MVGRKGDKRKPPPGGRAAERLRQFEEARGYPPPEGEGEKKPPVGETPKKPGRTKPSKGRKNP